jgi:hypothetical protein
MSLLTRPATGLNQTSRPITDRRTHKHASARQISCAAAVLLLLGCGSERPVPIRNQGAKSSESSTAQASADKKVTKDLDSKDAAKTGTEQNETADKTPLSPSELLSQAGEAQALLSLAPTIESYRLSANANIQTLTTKTELLSRIQGVNALLCSKYQDQSNSCPLLHRLIAQDSTQVRSPVTTCNASRESANPNTLNRQTPPSVWISLTIPGPKTSEKFFLRANKGTIRSSEFNAGSRTTLSWRSNDSGASQNTSPTIADLTDLQIATVSAAKLPDWRTGTTLEMGIQSSNPVNGQSVTEETKILSSKALLPWKLNALTADVTLTDIGDWNTSDRCLITEAQIDSLVASAKPVIQTIPTTIQKTEKREFTKFEEAQQALQQFTTQVKEAKNEIANLEGELERETERGIKLRAQLRNVKVSTCHARQPLRNIEIILKGEHLADSEWDRNSSEIEKKSEGLPERIEINLGTKITLINASEESSPIFNASGYLASNAFEALTAADIDFIRIKKMGTGFRSTLNCWNIIGWSRWGLGKKCEYQNSETNRYRMDSILIRVDGRDFYRSESLNFGFSGESKTWEEDRLSNSQDYTNFMTNDSCKGGT